MGTTLSAASPAKIAANDNAPQPGVRVPRPSTLGGAGLAECALVRVLWRAMKQRNRTRAWVAAAAGVRLEEMNQWRSGRRTPRLATLERCFSALDMDLVAVPRPGREARGV